MGKREKRKKHKFIWRFGVLLMLALAVGLLSTLPGRSSESPELSALPGVTVQETVNRVSMKVIPVEEPQQEENVVDLRQPQIPVEKEPEEPAPLDPDKPMLALTFDDGPGPYTDRLLDVFQEYGGKATFFVVGRNIGRQAEVLKRAAEEGHEIGGHGWNHYQMSKLSAEQMAREVTQTRDKILEVTGMETNLVRLPYGDNSKKVKTTMGELGVAMIHWTVDTLDWKYRNSDKVYQSVMGKAADGTIILCHDIHETTVAAMERIVPELIAQGYQLVTVSELLTCNGGAIEPGIVYIRQENPA